MTTKYTEGTENQGKMLKKREQHWEDIKKQSMKNTLPPTTTEPAERTTATTRPDGGVARLHAVSHGSHAGEVDGWEGVGGCSSHHARQGCTH